MTNLVISNPAKERVAQVGKQPSRLEHRQRCVNLEGFVLQKLRCATSSLAGEKSFSIFLLKNEFFKKWLLVMNPVKRGKLHDLEI
jgi:hypothetical protein